MSHNEPQALIALPRQSTDVRAFEFVSYAQLNPENFLTKLDEALQSVVGNPFANLYPEAVELFEQFRAAKGRDLVPSVQHEFEAAMTAVHGSGQRLPRPHRQRAEFLVRRLLGAEPEIQVLIDLKDWLEEVFP